MKNKPLSSIEWTTLYMAIRYAMNGRNIVTATLPADIIKAYYHRLTTAQMQSIVQDLKRNLEQHKCFGDPNIDNKHWLKFLGALDKENHFAIDTKYGSTHPCFEVEGVVYPLENYINNPLIDTYAPAEVIMRRFKKGDK